MGYEVPSHIQPLLQEAVAHDCETAQMLRNPAFHLPVKISIDGDHWCCLCGENLQDGVAGFGKSPDAAFHDFQRAWYEKLPDRSEVK